MVEKWKREVERFVPNAKGYIVENIKELISIEDKIKDKNKKEHAFIILSQSSAKFSYDMRPSANWSISKKAFCCPECGQVLKKEVTMGEGRDKYRVRVPLEKRDFTKENSYNQVCDNTVLVYDTEKGKYEDKKCCTKLWAPLNKNDTKHKWIKLGTEGWLYKEHFTEMYDEYFSKRKTLNKKDQLFLKKLMDKKNELTNTGDMKSSSNGIRKYSLAKYIREKMKGSIDYVILDEIHELKGKSLQGDAMGDLAMAANKVIGLTGTLLNGYADGLFYILYRTMPELMKSEGFEYTDEASFQRTYGVIRKTSEHELKSNGRRGNRIKSSAEKRLPGVSPLVFTKFLLENTVFVSIADMAEGLPAYTEIPIPVEMDAELASAYDTLESELRRMCSIGSGKGGMKVMGSFLQTMSTYPDMPYDSLPILHPDTAEVLCTPNDLPKGLRNKERELISLVQRKIAAGEKVLVYYEWSQKTDVAEKLMQAFREEDICAVDLTSKVKPKEREEWVQEQLATKDIDVLMCNPNLVKTGLDLLPFTTIVYYQMGYNIFTLRQSSRRSWRLGQDKDIEVYFMFYRNTIQEQAMSLMASKMTASMSLEGKFSEEGLRAMSNNEDLLSQIASSVVEGIKHTVDAEVFTNKRENSEINNVLLVERSTHERKLLSELLVSIFERKELSYLSRNQNNSNKDNAASKFMGQLFSGKVNLYDFYKSHIA